MGQSLLGKRQQAMAGYFRHIVAVRYAYCKATALAHLDSKGICMNISHCCT